MKTGYFFSDLKLNMDLVAIGLFYQFFRLIDKIILRVVHSIKTTI